jgi:hypothetical protein
MTAKADEINCLTINPPLGPKQGHSVLRWKMKINETVQETIVYQDKLLVHKGDYDNLNKYFIGIDWQSEFGHGTMNECYEAFLNRYEEGCRMFIPSIKQKTALNINKWSTKEIKTLTKKRNILWNLNRRSNWRDKDLRNEYSIINRELDKKTQEAVKNFEKTIIEKSKDHPKLIYAYLNSKRRIKSSIDELIDSDGSVISGTGEIANSLNDYFGSVHTKEEKNHVEYDKVTNFISPNIEIVSLDVEQRLARLDGTIKLC